MVEFVVVADEPDPRPRGGDVYVSMRASAFLPISDVGSREAIDIAIKLFTFSATPRRTPTQ